MNSHAQRLIAEWGIRHRQTITIPKGNISAEGLHALAETLAEAGLPVPPLTTGESEHAPDSDWSQWMILKGDLAGTWPKRYAKWCYRKRNTRPNPATLGVLGEIARRHTQTEETVSVDITDRFDWGRYDFGQSDGSCYWGDRTHARDLLEHHDALAVRYYREDGKGIARVWLWTHLPDALILHNAYGPHALVFTARLVATTLGLAYAPAELTDHGDDSGEVWINGGKCYAVAPLEVLGESYDLNTDHNAPYNYAEEPDEENDEDDNIGYCYHCEATLHEGDEVNLVGGECYCAHCTRRLFNQCESCNEYMTRDHSYTVEDERGNDLTYCESCWESTTNCDQCNCSFTDSVDMTQANDQNYCPSCRDELLTQCAKCDEWIEKKDAVDLDGETCCQDCADDDQPEQLPLAIGEAPATRSAEYTDAEGTTYRVTIQDVEVTP